MINEPALNPYPAPCPGCNGDLTRCDLIQIRDGYGGFAIIDSNKDTMSWACWECRTMYQATRVEPWKVKRIQ